jgi:hypothetical protein
MGQDGFSRRELPAWRRGRPSLRVRLAAVAVCLLAAGAGIIVVAGSLAARDQLTRQAGQLLRGYAGQLGRHPFLLTPLSRTAPGPAGLSLTAAGDGALGIAVRDSGGQLVMRTGPGGPAGPAGTVQPSRGGYLAIAEPIHYRAHRIPYAYSADDFVLDVSPAGPGAPGTLVVSLSLARIGRATGHLTAVMLAVSGLVALAAGALAAWMISAMLWPLTWLGHRAEAIAAGRAAAAGPPASSPSGGPRRGCWAAAPALTVLLTQLEHAGDAAAGPGPPGDLPGGAALASRRVTERRRQAIVDTSRELRKLVSILAGLAEYYRLHDQPGPGGFDRLLDRVAEETARIDALIHTLEGTVQDEPGSPAPRETVGRSA